VIGKTAKGTFYFDHTPAASASAIYTVRTVDGDGNLSPPAATTGGPASTVTADDASPDITYTGGWAHLVGANSPYNGTQSEASGLPCHLACQDFSGTQGGNGWGYQDGPPVACSLACQQFSGVQGQDGWSYQTATSGVWADIATYHEPFGLLGECCAWYDISDTDFSGLVTPRYMLGGIGHDVARVWTAPKDGVVDITAQAIPFTDGNQSVLTVTVNGQPVWGPQAMDGTPTPLDTSVANVAVTAGDVIRFEIQAGTALSLSNLVRWDPDIRYPADPPPPPPPTWADIATFHSGESFSGDGPYWHDSAGYVSARYLQPAADRDVARTWTAPRDGTIDIAGHASGGNATVSITRNDQVVWGPQTAGDIDTSVSGIPVSAGDVIRFQVAAAGGSVRWDPDVWYEGDPQPVTPAVAASWTFTGSQVTWYAEIGPNHGTAQVLIDGQPDTAINLSGPSVGDWSIPVYVKTFPVAGTHTITIQAPPDTGGSTIDVDGFQAVTTSPAVTQDTARKVDYDGRGWARQSAAAASGGSVTASSRAGDAVSFSFTGASVTWVGRVCAACGEADVYLDGRYVTRVDTFGFRGPEVWQAGVFQHSWAYIGKHTLKIVVDGTQNLASAGAAVNVDSFQVGGG
jgi:hypothetical protein